MFCDKYPGSLKSSISPLQFFFFFKLQGMYFLKIFDILPFSFSTRLFPLSVLIGALGIEKPTEKCDSGNTSSDGFPGLIKTLRSIWVINSSEQNLRVAEKFLKKVFHFLRDSATKSLDLPVDKAITGLVSTFYKSISYKMWQNLQSHCSIKYLIRKKPIRTALRFPLCLGHVEAKYEK